MRPPRLPLMAGPRGAIKSLTPGPDEDGSLASFIPEQFFLLINYKNSSPGKKSYITV